MALQANGAEKDPGFSLDPMKPSVRLELSSGHPYRLEVRGTAKLREVHHSEVV